MKELGSFTCRWWLWRILIKQIMDKFSFQVAPTAVPKTEGRRKILKQIVQNNHSPGDPVQFSSVAQLCPTLCDPMNCSTPGLRVHHQLPEFTQTHAHWVGDAIQPSHPLSSLLFLPPIPPSIRVFSNESTLEVAKVSQHQGLFQWVNSWGGQSIGVSASASVLPMNTQDWSPLGWTGWI